MKQDIRPIKALLEQGAKQVKLSTVKQGEYIRRKASSQTTYKREHYCREDRKYCLSDCNDVNREIFLSGKTLVWVGFNF